MDDRVCPQCGKSAYRFPKCPWCGSSYSQPDAAASHEFRAIVEERSKSGSGIYVWVLLLSMLLGPFAIGILGVVFNALNDYLGFSPVNQGGLIAALHWAPILVYVTWPIAILIALIAAAWVIVKGVSQRGNKK